MIGFRSWQAVRQGHAPQKRAALVDIIGQLATVIGSIILLLVFSAPLFTNQFLAAEGITEFSASLVVERNGTESILLLLTVFSPWLLAVMALLTRLVDQLVPLESSFRRWVTGIWLILGIVAGVSAIALLATALLADFSRLSAALGFEVLFTLFLVVLVSHAFARQRRQTDHPGVRLAATEAQAMVYAVGVLMGLSLFMSHFRPDVFQPLGGLGLAWFGLLTLTFGAMASAFAARQWMQDVELDDSAPQPLDLPRPPL